MRTIFDKAKISRGTCGVPMGYKGRKVSIGSNIQNYYSQPICPRETHCLCKDSTGQYTCNRRTDPCCKK